MPGPAAALLALLFFAPAAFVYGRRVAARIGRRARAQGRPPLILGLPKLVAPLLLTFAVAHRLGVDPASTSGWRSLDAGLALLDALGGLALILFFVAIPFVLGRLFGVVAASLGFFADFAPSVLRGEAGDGKGAGFDLGPERPAGEGFAMAPKLTIAIDGPAAAGKGTLAKRLSQRYGIAYLDTGLLYRAVGRRAFDAGIDLDDAAAAGAVARQLTPSALDDGSLRGREAGELASRVAAHPEVRSALEAFQRDFARQPGGAVLDGRDIGTVIAPDAEIKIFVTASPEVRARRRTEELSAKGRPVDFERILAEVKERDARDAGRSVAPLRPAADAHLLDTSELDIEAAFQAACELIDRFLAGRSAV